MDNPQGLGTGTYPKLTKAQKDLSPIDRLADTKLHDGVLAHLNKRLQLSEEAMQRFYGRWRVNELKYQAFIDLPDWEQQLKELNDKGEPSKCVSITVPYSFSVLNTITTYLIHMFCGSSPMFSVTSSKSDYIDAAQSMEQVLQYNCDHTRMVKQLYQFLNDACMYGVGIMRNQWKVEKKMRTSWIETSTLGFAGLSMGGKKWQRNRKKTTVFEGNETASIDPFMFFPDPRVPMAEVNARGEFVFWKDFLGKHDLLAMQNEGTFKYVGQAPAVPADWMSSVGSNLSARGVLAFGNSQAGVDNIFSGRTDVYETTQGTCIIIPAELGLGEEDYPVKYLFTWLNKKQIVQAEPLDYDHDKHPVIVTEPYSMGYGFGQPGILDYMAPLQDVMSWLINSHMDNVKTMLNNMWLVDPSRVEMQDLKQQGPGKLIRLKRAAYGTDVNAAVRQLTVGDVTSGHLTDFELVMRMADSLAAVNDNLRGLQDSGSRKTATEVRTSADSGASRLASLGTKISAQAITDLTEQMSINIQQFMSDDFSIDILGNNGDSIKVGPQMLVGDFNYPVHDGTLPMDKVAMLDVWKQIFQGVAADPQLRQQFNVTGIFGYLAKLGGAKNIDQFTVQQKPDAAVEAGLQSGNMVPLSEAAKTNPTPGVVPNPGDRMAGGL